jgi:hypothetical protein
VRVELTHAGFADRSLPSWLLRHSLTTTAYPPGVEPGTSRLTGGRFVHRTSSGYMFFFLPMLFCMAVGAEENALSRLFDQPLPALDVVQREPELLVALVMEP